MFLLKASELSRLLRPSFLTPFGRGSCSRSVLYADSIRVCMSAFGLTASLPGSPPIALATGSASHLPARCTRIPPTAFPGKLSPVVVSHGPGGSFPRARHIPSPVHRCQGAVSPAGGFTGEDSASRSSEAVGSARPLGPKERGPHPHAAARLGATLAPRGCCGAWGLPGPRTGSQRAACRDAARCTVSLGRCADSVCRRGSVQGHPCRPRPCSSCGREPG